MCYASSCNPTCGNCRPKRLIEAYCPACGATNSLNREEYLIVFKLPHKKNVLEKKILERGGVPRPSCKQCGADMYDVFDAAVTPEPCTKSRVICGFPCGRHVEPYVEGSMPCPTMVPVGKLEQ